MELQISFPGEEGCEINHLQGLQICLVHGSSTAGQRRSAFKSIAALDANVFCSCRVQRSSCRVRRNSKYVINPGRDRTAGGKPQRDGRSPQENPDVDDAYC